MKKIYIAGFAIFIALAGFMLLRATSGVTTNIPVAAYTAPSSYSSPSATARIATTSAASNPEAVVPGLYPNPIRNTATQAGLKLSGVMVENNTDASGKPVSDHLQFTLQNLTAQTLSSLEVYYTITDTANGKQEGYYQPLTGVSIPPLGSLTVHFDNQTGKGHYPANMHGIYGTTLDQLKFSVEVSATGYAPIAAQATKAPGGAEVVGQ